MREIVEKLEKEFKDDILEIFEHNEKRVYIKINNEALLKIAEFLHKKLGLRFVIASATDLKEGFEIIYHFSDDKKSGAMINIRVLMPHNKPEIESLTQVFRGAEWIEREIYDLLGIKFLNHPNLVRFLLPEDWPEGVYPLRRESR